jgi:hypothetical protein
MTNVDRKIASSDTISVSVGHGFFSMNSTLAPDLHDHAAGLAGDVGAAHVAQVTADQPGTRPQADEPGRAHPPSHRGLGVGKREEPGDLRRTVGLLRPLPWQRQVRRVELRDDPPADEPQVRAQRAARRLRQARRAPGEPLSGRRVQHYLRHQVGARRGERALGRGRMSRESGTFMRSGAVVGAAGSAMSEAYGTFRGGALRRPPRRQPYWPPGGRSPLSRQSRPAARAMVTQLDVHGRATRGINGPARSRGRGVAWGWR